MDNFNYREFIYGQSLFNGKEDDKQQLNESAPGYDTRKFGEALPTLESVKAAHEAKEMDASEQAEKMKELKDLADKLNAQAEKIFSSTKDLEDQGIKMPDDVEQYLKDLSKKLKDSGVKENMYIDDEEFEMEMGRSKKDSLKKEMMIHVDQLLDGNIDMNDFMNVVEDIMGDLK